MEIGGHCSVSHCHQLSFLPFKCNACSLLFCSDHRTYEAHCCAVWKPHIPRVLVCSDCSTSLHFQGSDDMDDILSLHLATDCPGLFGGRKNGESPVKRRTCIVRGCCEDISISGTSCKLCKQRVCLTHRFERDHRCLKLQETDVVLPHSQNTPPPSSFTRRKLKKRPDPNSTLEWRKDLAPTCSVM